MTLDRKFKACLFDMDGLLINSESLYTISFTEILIKLGIPQGLTWPVKLKQIGLPGSGACQVLIDEYGLQDKITADEMFEITSKRQEELWSQTQLLPGVAKLITSLHEKKIPICVCTSSNMSKFVSKTKHLEEVFKYFEGNVIAGDNPAILGKGKPQPYIWWLGLDTLNEKLGLVKDEEKIKPEECLIFEDAIHGFISGKRAGGYVIWVPDLNAKKLITDEQVADLVGNENKYGLIYDSLDDFDPSAYGL